MSKPRFNFWEVCEKLSAPHPKRQPEQSENRNGHDIHFSRAQADSHDQCDRYRHCNGENAPRALRERLDDDQREYSKQDNHYRQHADERERANPAADLFLHHLSECFAATPD